MKNYIFFLLLLVSANYSIAQCCIEAPITGPLCAVCAPPGWDIFTGTPDTGQDGVGVGGGGGCIAEFSSTQLYDGGTVSLFQGGDAIVTNVGGLTPGTGYVIGFEWQPIAWDCPIGGWDTNPNAQMNITIAGSSSVLDWSGSGWDSHIVCFTATSNIAEVIIEHIPVSGVVCLTAVDYIPCTELESIHNCGECCDLIVELDQGAVLCPDEIFQITGDYINESGSPIITWECNPPSGLNYLDDLSSPNPNFIFPYTGDFDGEIYEFTLLVEDDVCTRSDEIIIEVLPIYEVSFDLLLCSNEDLSDLPLISVNNYTGTWSGPSDFNLWANSVANFTFELDPGQGNCLVDQSFNFFINNTVEADFSLTDEYCSIDTDPIFLPTTSDNGIEGFWDVSQFTPSDYGSGNYSFYYTANNELCFEVYELEIVITDGFIPQFSLPTVLCSDELPFVFPSISDDNFEGTWLEPSINEISNDYEIFENTFIPTLQDCVAEVIVQITVQLVTIPSFDFETSYCKLDELVVPNGVSNEGYLGSWNPPIIDPAASPAGSINLIWTPSNTDDCVEPVSMTIDIEAEVLYSFNQENIFCLDEVYVFPTTTDNGMVTGIWFYPDLASLPGSGDYTNIFFPDPLLCANEIIFEFEVVEEQIPEFTLPTYLCADDNNFMLPTNSINNLDGSWNMDEIDVQASIGQTIGVIFSPDNPDCSGNFETTIQVLDVISINYEVFPPSDCSSTDGMITILNPDPSLSFSIDNGGTWQSNLEFTGLAAGAYTILTQHNFAPDCTQDFPALIESLAYPQVDIISQSDNTSCNNPNGSIVFNSNSTEEVEYSIDVGVTWQPESIFENLTGGLYEIIIRFINSPSCTTLRMVNLNEPTLPIIEDIIVAPLTDCLSANGSLYIASNSLSIEYSINGGLSWQTDPLFENLEEGSYEVLVRNIGTDDCQAQAIELIEALVIPEIISTNFTNPTDCGEANGSFVIEVSGIDLSYSIDGGVTWTETPMFNNLAAGNYDLIINTTSSTNCELYLPFSLESPNQPIIDMVILSNPTSCQENIGQIEITGATSNFEFSIDGGNTWQDEALFNQLVAGDYEIIIRDQNAPACSIVEVASLFAEASNLDMIPFVENNPSDCMLSDGSIEFNASPSVGLSYSINGGDDFQADPIFENLSQGNYELVVMLNNNEDCSFRTTVELIDPDCPCDNYELMYDVVDVSCNQEALGEIEIYLLGDEELTWSNSLTDSNLQNLESGWYFLTVTYEEGNCEHFDSIFINEVEAINFTIDDFPSDCEDIANGSFLVQNVSGGSGNYMFSINGGNLQSSNEFDNLAEGAYELLVQDDEACTGIGQIEIVSNDPVTINLLEEISIQMGDTILLDPLIDEMSIDSFIWSPIESILNTEELPILVTSLENTSYELTVYFGGCSVSSIVAIIIENVEEIEEFIDIFVPNVLDADSDTNNSFYIQGDELVQIESMSIFDRWGNRVYYLEQPEINNPLSGWIPDESLEIGVYVYFIELMQDGQVVPMVGSVTNLR